YLQCFCVLVSKDTMAGIIIANCLVCNIIICPKPITLQPQKQTHMKVVVVGATGLVGSAMLKVLEERNFPVSELIPVASEKSVGKEVVFKGNKYKVVSAETAISMKPELALFSAGGS